MKPSRFAHLAPCAALAALAFLPSCAGIPGESPEHMRERLARQDQRFDQRLEKRQLRSEAADRRYNKSWDAAMGRHPSGW